MPPRPPIFRAMQEIIDRMRARVQTHTDGIRRDTPVPHLGIGVVCGSGVAGLTVYEPMACLVLQGSKEVLIGERTLHYGTGCCFVVSLELPATGCVLKTPVDEPYIVLSLSLDREAIATLIADMPPPSREAQSPAAFGVAPASPALLEAWDRFLGLLDTPADVPFLAATHEREILYRLLQSPHGPMLRSVVREDGRLAGIRRAIGRIKEDFDQALPIATLADLAGMSIPSFHRHFKAATAMSPLQYQKTMRLQAARRLLAGNIDAGRAAYAVGYESASQFSREYARLFGSPPSRDAERLRAGAGQEEIAA